MNADPIARAYRWLEYAAFGRALERCRTAQLPFVADAARVLILGEGDGRFLAQFLKTNPRASVDVVDSSAAMLALAQKRIGSRERVRFIHADALAFEVREPYDLVVTNFFLDCLSDAEARALVERLSSARLWIVGEFSQEGIYAKLWVRGMYLFFRLATGLSIGQIPDYAPMLRGAGFARVREQRLRFGLIRSELWSRT